MSPLQLFVFFAALCGLAFGEVRVLTPENFDSVVGGDKNVLVEFYAPWCGHCKALEPKYEELGQLFAHSPSVIIAKVDADKHGSLSSRFGVKGFPTLQYFAAGSTTGKDYSGNRETADLVAFLNREAGTNVRIATPPTDVTVLDSANFDKIVMDESKHVFVKFYAPWCGHCKSLAPDWEKLALAFKAEPNVVIAKCDADAETAIKDRFSISGFPTLKMFKSGSKSSPEPYNSGRSLQELVTYVNSVAGTRREASGRLNSQAGRIMELDDVALLVMSEAGHPTAEQEAQAVVESLDPALKADGLTYVRILKSIALHGKPWVATELARMKSLLGSGSLTPKKIDEFTKKMNILSAFEV